MSVMDRMSRDVRLDRNSSIIRPTRHSLCDITLTLLLLEIGQLTAQKSLTLNFKLKV